MANISSALSVNHFTLPNRLVLPPLALEKADINGMVTPEMLAHYDRLSHGGYFSMVIVEHSFVAPQGRASKRQLSIAADDTIKGLSQLAGVLHHNGVKAIAQVSHAGGATSRAITGFDTCTPSGVPARGGEADGVLDLQGIQETVALFAAAARRARAAGFDGVELHSAHGYLLNQFYSPLTNKRDDGYGGDVTGRTRIHREVISAVRKEVGKDFPLLLRLGACDYQEGGNSIADAVQAAKILEEAGIDILDISGGMNGSVLKGRENEQGFYSEVTKALKRECALPLILTGGITDIHAADALVNRGAADLIGVGRAMLRDPDWARCKTRIVARKL